MGPPHEGSICERMLLPQSYISLLKQSEVKQDINFIILYYNDDGGDDCGSCINIYGDDGDNDDDDDDASSGTYLYILTLYIDLSV